MWKTLYIKLNLKEVHGLTFVDATTTSYMICFWKPTLKVIQLMKKCFLLFLQNCQHFPELNVTLMKHNLFFTNTNCFSMLMSFHSRCDASSIWRLHVANQTTHCNLWNIRRIMRALTFTQTNGYISTGNV